MIEIIPADNLFPHRKKLSIQDEWPIVIKEEVSRKDLKNDPNIDQAALKKVGAAKTEDEFFNQDKRLDQSNLNLENPTEDEDNDVLVKLTYWGTLDGEESVICVVNFETVVRMERNPFWHQQKPFVKLDYEPDSNQFFVEGLVAQNFDSQNELNELRNTRSKARSMALKTPLLVDRGANVNLDELKWEHSAVWLYDQLNNPNPITPVTINSRLLEINNEEVSVKSDMQLRSGMNDVTVGQDVAGIVGGDTATGAALAAEQTALRFRTQAILIDQAIKALGEQFIANIQQFVEKDKAFQVIGEEGFEWREYNAEQMRQFRYDFVVAPMSTFVESTIAKREKLLQVKQLFAEDESFDQDKLDRMILESFGMDSEQLKKPRATRDGEELSGELEQLADFINSPDFAQLGPEEQAAVKERLVQLQEQVGALE